MVRGPCSLRSRMLERAGFIRSAGSSHVLLPLLEGVFPQTAHSRRWQLRPWGTRTLRQEQRPRRDGRRSEEGPAGRKVLHWLQRQSTAPHTGAKSNGDVGSRSPETRRPDPAVGRVTLRITVLGAGPAPRPRIPGSRARPRPRLPGSGGGPRPRPRLPHPRLQGSWARPRPPLPRPCLPGSGVGPARVSPTRVSPALGAGPAASPSV